VSNVKGGLGGIVKQAQRMQQQISRIQDGLASTDVEASAGGGAVVAVVNGRQELVKLQLAKEAVDPEEIDTLEELILAAVNLAMKNSQDMIQSEVNKVTGGLNIPGLF
jgi:DNA-binding YbaB/EbfC family protein